MVIKTGAFLMAFGTNTTKEKQTVCPLFWPQLPRSFSHGSSFHNVFRLAGSTRWTETKVPLLNSHSICSNISKSPAFFILLHRSYPCAIPAYHWIRQVFPLFSFSSPRLTLLDKNCGPPRMGKPQLFIHFVCFLFC